MVLLDEATGVGVWPLERRGSVLRHAPGLAEGANVNAVGRLPNGAWAMRTFERGVEGETLACGTGAVACAILLAAWGLGQGGLATDIQTRSGRTLTVRLEQRGNTWLSTLRGEGRLVFEGSLRDL